MSSHQTQDVQGPGRPILWAIRLGAAFVALMAAWRLGMSLYSMLGDHKLAVREASLTFMWIPDLFFLAVFGYLAFACRQIGRRRYQEIGLVASGLQIVFLVATLVVFRRWTDAEALGFDDPLTWLHILLPSLWCGWFLLYLLLQAWLGRRGT